MVRQSIFVLLFGPPDSDFFDFLYSLCFASFFKAERIFVLNSRSIILQSLPFFHFYHFYLSKVNSYDLLCALSPYKVRRQSDEKRKKERRKKGE